MFVERMVRLVDSKNVYKSLVGKSYYKGPLGVALSRKEGVKFVKWISFVHVKTQFPVSVVVVVVVMMTEFHFICLRTCNVEILSD
jgi:hypothetical protein